MTISINYIIIRLIRFNRKYDPARLGVHMSHDHTAFGVSKKAYDAIFKLGFAHGKAIGYVEGLEVVRTHIQKKLDAKLPLSSDLVRPSRVPVHNVREANPGSPHVERLLEDLALTPKWYNILKRAEVNLIGDVPASISEAGFLRLDLFGFGHRGVLDLRTALAAFELELPHFPSPRES